MQARIMIPLALSFALRSAGIERQLLHLSSNQILCCVESDILDNALYTHPYLCSTVAEETNSWAKGAFLLTVIPREAIWHKRSNAICDIDGRTKDIL